MPAKCQLRLQAAQSPSRQNWLKWTPRMITSSSWMPQPDVIITSMTTALIQCMILTGNGCKRRPVRADRADVPVVSVFTCFMNSISP
jgi:hypothetical protein